MPPLLLHSFSIFSPTVPIPIYVPIIIIFGTKITNDYFSNITTQYYHIPPFLTYLYYINEIFDQVKDYNTSFDLI